MHKVQIPTSLDYGASLEGHRGGLDIFQHLDVKPFQTCRQSAASTSHCPNNLRSSSPTKERRRLVIFDKDGTLVCIHAMWAPWICGLAQRLESATGHQLTDKVFDTVSFDGNSNQIKPGLLGEGTMQELQDTLTDLLVRECCMPRQTAVKIMRECWQARELDCYGDMKSVGDVGQLFAVLKSKGYLIAVNTSDNRHVTEKTLCHLNVRHLVDMVVCGDDEDILPKPHPSTAMKICGRLEIDPRDAVMIGDSTSDMRLRESAGLGCAIGVLTGIAPREVLEKDADIVVDNIHQALSIILDHHQ